MKNVRLFYRKTGLLRFVSHLDMNRFFIRAVRRAGLPIWVTEGFNPHPYLVFAMPLPLGFESEYECLDLRLTDDAFPIDTLTERLNAVCPDDLRLFAAAEPIAKIAALAFARYTVTFDDGGALAEPLAAFVRSEPILCRKRTKKGEEREIDLSAKISEAEVSAETGQTVLRLCLPAGAETISPELLLQAFFERASEQYFCYRVTRTALLDTDKTLFR